MQNKIQQEILKDHQELLQALNKFKYLDYIRHQEDISDDMMINITMYLDDLNNVLSQYSNEYIHQCERILTNNYRKTKRLKERIALIVANDNAKFLTMTFSDELLAKTSEATRRTYIARFLKEVSSCYVANIDYGKSTEREHYHACINAYNEYYKYQTLIDKYQEYTDSIIFIEDIHTPNFNKIAKYITKLTNHAQKETTYNNKILYSKI